MQDIRVWQTGKSPSFGAILYAKGEGSI